MIRSFLKSDTTETAGVEARQTTISSQCSPGQPLNSGGSPIHALVVDDNVDFCNSIRELLKPSGVEIESATNPVKALEIFTREKDKFNLVMVDYYMPHLNGTQVWEWLRKISPDVKVIMVSGMDELRARQIMAQYPIDGFIRKPCRIQEALDVIHQVMTVTVPTAATSTFSATKERLPEAPCDAEPEAKSSILVIDDDPMVLQTVKSVLVKEGYNVLTSLSASKGLEMIRYAGSNLPLVLLDYKMPRLAGDKTLVFARRLSPAVKVLGITAVDLKSVPDEFRNGVDRLLTKPLVAAQLIDAVHELLGDRKVETSHPS